MARPSSFRVVRVRLYALLRFTAALWQRLRRPRYLYSVGILRLGSRGFGELLGRINCGQRFSLAHETGAAVRDSGAGAFDHRCAKRFGRGHKFAYRLLEYIADHAVARMAEQTNRNIAVRGDEQ